MLVYVVITIVLIMLIIMAYKATKPPTCSRQAKEPNNESISDCWYCNNKWECYERFFKGRKNPCSSEERIINIEKYKNWEEERKNR